METLLKKRFDVAHKSYILTLIELIALKLIVCSSIFVGKLSQLPIVSWKVNWFPNWKRKNKIDYFWVFMVWKTRLFLEIEWKHIDCQRSIVYLFHQGMWIEVL